MPIRLDEIDRKILHELQENARIIRKYVALLDANALRIGVTVFAQISLDSQAQERVEMFEKAIVRRPEVLECDLMSGEADYLLRVAVPDVPTYVRLLVNRLSRLPGLACLKSSFVFREVKRSTRVPLSTNVPAFRISPIHARRR